MLVYVGIFEGIWGFCKGWFLPLTQSSQLATIVWRAITSSGWLVVWQVENSRNQHPTSESSQSLSSDRWNETFFCDTIPQVSLIDPKKNGLKREILRELNLKAIPYIWQVPWFHVNWNHVIVAVSPWKNQQIGSQPYFSWNKSACGKRTCAEHTKQLTWYSHMYSAICALKTSKGINSAYAHISRSMVSLENDRTHLCPRDLLRDPQQSTAICWKKKT